MHFQSVVDMTCLDNVFSDLLVVLNAAKRVVNTAFTANRIWKDLEGPMEGFAVHPSIGDRTFYNLENFGYN